MVEGLVSYTPVKRGGCPFYGFHLNPDFKVFTWSGGNQCALIHTSFHPCDVELQGQVPNWRVCPYSTDPLTERLLERFRVEEFRFFPRGDSHIGVFTFERGISFEEWMARFGLV